MSWPDFRGSGCWTSPGWSGHRISPEWLALCGLLWRPFGSEVAADGVSRCRAARAMAGAVRRGAVALLAGDLNGPCVLFWRHSRSSMAWRGLLRWMRSWRGVVVRSCSGRAGDDEGLWRRGACGQCQPFSRQRLDDAQPCHVLATAGAFGLGWLQRRRFGCRACAEDLMETLPLLFGGGAVQAVVPHAHESLRQHMQTPAT